MAVPHGNVSQLGAPLVPTGGTQVRITFLTQYYPPEVGAPQARISDLVGHFRARGHTVTVLTALPNYPIGEIYPGYGGLCSVRDESGTKVIRTWLYATKSADYLRRITNYISFTISSALGGSFLLNDYEF